MNAEYRKCLCCNSTTLKWYGYASLNDKLYACKRHRTRLQEVCPQTIIFPIPRLTKEA